MKNKTTFLNENLSIYLVWELKKRKTEDGYKWSMIHTPVNCNFTKIREVNYDNGTRILHREENLDRIFKTVSELHPEITREMFDAAGIIIENDITKNKIRGILTEAKPYT